MPLGKLVVLPRRRSHSPDAEALPHSSQQAGRKRPSIIPPSPITKKSFVFHFLFIITRRKSTTENRAYLPIYISHQFLYKMYFSTTATTCLTTLLSLTSIAVAVSPTTVYTATSTSYSYSTSPIPDCGPFSTVAADSASCSPGCYPYQMPGAFGRANANSPYRCSARPEVETVKATMTKTVTCGAGSTMREMTPGYGAVWAKCTGEL